MPKHDLWICDRCGSETIGEEMRGMWQPVKVGTEEWYLCPVCAGKASRVLKDLIAGDTDE